jgi:hypothetical protein
MSFIPPQLRQELKSFWPIWIVSHGLLSLIIGSVAYGLSQLIGSDGSATDFITVAIALFGSTLYGYMEYNLLRRWGLAVDNKWWISITIGWCTTFFTISILYIWLFKWPILLYGIGATIGLLLTGNWQVAALEDAELQGISLRRWQHFYLLSGIVGGVVTGIWVWLTQRYFPQSVVTIGSIVIPCLVTSTIVAFPLNYYFQYRYFRQIPASSQPSLASQTRDRLMKDPIKQVDRQVVNEER